MKLSITNIKTLIGFSYCSLLAVSGCDVFLDVPPPKTELATTSVFTGNSTANAAITSIYARMATSNGTPFSDISWLSGLSADEFVNYGTTEEILAFHTNSLASVNSSVTNYLWTPYYNIIFQANAVMEGLQENNEVSENVKRQLHGEAKFIRALYHFYLANFFGDIPIITSTDYRINATLPRNSQTSVYEQVTKDLIDAVNLLNTHYVGTDGISSSHERVRPNQAAAQALLGRVYLYMGEYEKAEQETSLVIDNPLYELPEDLSIVFQANSMEAIWQVQPIPNTITTYAGRYVLSGPPNSGLARSVTISNSILDHFETGDLRLSNWVGSITVDENTFLFSNKLRLVVNDGSEYDMVMRLAEQYLIRAEARIHLGRIAEGIADLNALRSRADVPEFDMETVDADPLSLVEGERVRELFAEGHRWFDLRRTDRIDEVMEVVAPTKGGQWNAYAKLYPIPEIERNNNPNLSQNDGY